jgi:hypothetical protein
MMKKLHVGWHLNSAQNKDKNQKKRKMDSAKVAQSSTAMLQPNLSQDSLAT